LEVNLNSTSLMTCLGKGLLLREVLSGHQLF